MRKIHPMVAALAAVTIAFAACEQQAGEEGATEETAADSVDNEAALEDFRTSFEEAFAARDWDAMMALHTSDYVEITPAGETMGYDEMGTAMRDSANQPPEGGTLTIETESMEIAESGDLAYGTGTAVFSFTGPDGQEIRDETRWMAGFEKVDGEWKLDRLAQVSTGGEDGAMEGGMDEGMMDDAGVPGEGAAEGEGTDSSM